MVPRVGFGLYLRFRAEQPPDVVGAGDFNHDFSLDFAGGRAPMIGTDFSEDFNEDFGG